MQPELASLADRAALVIALLVALLFKPWLPLRHPPLQNPWCCALLITPWVWWTQQLLPSGMALHVSGAGLLVLMFGWPLAMWTLLPVSLLAQFIQARGWPDFSVVVAHAVWLGVIPGTLALLLGLVVRHWLPKHLFVYILGRGFIVTALALALTGVLALAAGHKPDTLATAEWLLAHWLLGWGEAISTGMLTASTICGIRAIPAICPVCPPASVPCATTASHPASSAATAWLTLPHMLHTWRPAS